MRWNFWAVLVLLFLFSNEYLSKFALGLFVGDLGVSNAIDRTFQFASFSSYFFSAGFRAIPFLALAVISVKSHYRHKAAGRFALWLALSGISAFHLFGYWEMQHSLFTNERASSTAAIAVIWIPVWATILLGLGYAILRIAEQILRMFRARA